MAPMAKTMPSTGNPLHDRVLDAGAEINRIHGRGRQHAETVVAGTQEIVGDNAIGFVGIDRLPCAVRVARFRAQQAITWWSRRIPRVAQPLDLEERTAPLLDARHAVLQGRDQVGDAQDEYRDRVLERQHGQHIA